MMIIKIISIITLLIGSNLYASNQLPQFDVSTFSQQIFWFITLFSVVFIFLKYITIPKITSIHNTRKNRFIIKIEKAEKIKKKIDKIDVSTNELQQTLVNQELLLNQQLSKKIDDLNYSKRESFEQYKQERKQQFHKKILEINDSVKLVEQYEVKQLTKLILSKLQYNKNNKTIDTHVE